MDKPKGTIRAIGEIALRVRNLDLMQAFYEHTLGLELLRRFENMAFLKVAPGFEGHIQVLALLDGSLPPDHASCHFAGLNVQTTSLHHMAFTISQADYTAEKERFQQLGLEVETREHHWMHVRSLYLPDPEGNVVELVCYAENVGQPALSPDSSTADV